MGFGIGFNRTVRDETMNRIADPVELFQQPEKFLLNNL